MPIFWNIVITMWVTWLFLLIMTYFTSDVLEDKKSHHPMKALLGGLFVLFMVVTFIAVVAEIWV